MADTFSENLKYGWESLLEVQGKNIAGRYQQTLENKKFVDIKQTFLPIIWIFTEDVGDGIESRLPFKIFSTLQILALKWFLPE